MTALNVPTQVEIDPFDQASNPPTQTYDLFGKVEINAWACSLEKGAGKVPYDATNPNHKRLTAIQVFIAPLAEIEVKYPKTCECDWIAEFPTWAKITLPSIKAAGYANIREINGKFARVARVDGLDKPYNKKDANGNLTGEQAVKKTFKFVEFYETEDECRAAYVAAGGQAANHVEPVADPNDAEKATNYAFLKVIVPNAARGKATLEDAKIAVTVALAAYPTVAKYYTAESPETLELINATLKV